MGCSIETALLYLTIAVEKVAVAMGYLLKYRILFIVLLNGKVLRRKMEILA